MGRSEILIEYFHECRLRLRIVFLGDIPADAKGLTLCYVDQS